MRYVRTILAISALLLILGCTFNRVELQNITFISLNQDELTIYEQFKQNDDDSILQGVDPITIAKFYVWSEYEADYDVSYRLYTQREGHVAWTQEEDQAIPVDDREYNKITQ